MTTKHEKSLARAKLTFWIIFAIPSILFIIQTVQFILFANDAEIHALLASGGMTMDMILPIAIALAAVFYIVFFISFFFFGRYFVEKAKNMILQEQVEQLSK